LRRFSGPMSIRPTTICCSSSRGLFNCLTTALAPRVHQFANCHRARPLPQQLQSDISYIGKLIHLLYAQFPCETGRPTSRVEFNGLTDFQNFCTAGKRTKFATNTIWHYPPHLRHIYLHYTGKLKIQIFYRCGRKRKQIAFLNRL